MLARRSIPRPPEFGIKENGMTVQQIPISRIKPNPHNARTHSAKQIRQIADSIIAFGFTTPVLVGEDGELFAGHGRYAAAKLLGLEKVPAIVVAGLSPAKRASPCDRRQQDRRERRMGSRAPRDRDPGIGRAVSR